MRKVILGDDTYHTESTQNDVIKNSGAGDRERKELVPGVSRGTLKS